MFEPLPETGWILHSPPIIGLPDPSGLHHIGVPEESQILYQASTRLLVLISQSKKGNLRPEHRCLAAIIEPQTERFWARFAGATI